MEVRTPSLSQDYNAKSTTQVDEDGGASKTLYRQEEAANLLENTLEDSMVVSGSMSDILKSEKVPVFICPPFDRSRFRYQVRPRCCGCIPNWIIKWAIPWFLAGFGFFLQNFQLRVGTYYYVHVMVQHELDRKEGSNKYGSADSIPLTIGESSKDMSFGSLQDDVIGLLGPYQPVHFKVLDMLAAVFVFLFVVLTVAMDNLFTWTRIMVCFFVLAVGKGFFSWITIVPDSIGWHLCKARLATGKYSVDWYMQERSLAEIFVMDPRSRLCADMMYSGHTYFVTLFALGLHECIRMSLRKGPARIRILAETSVAICAILHQAIEIYFVLKSRFHYTSDVVMAVVLTYLLYTNISIATVAGWWMNLSERDQNKINILKAELSGQEHGAHNEFINEFSSPAAFTSLGCCCCSWTQQYTYTRNQLFKIMNAVERNLSRPPGKRSRMTKEVQMRIRENLRMLDRDSILDDGCWDEAADREVHERHVIWL